ncbi:hypothetical protein ACIRDZ_10110 [Streptomyces swartbergensis]|uniref:hypothetical protein n=1 Tax=Streptomyces swartbergensis TaxID=487165 RepID=UPI003821378B
MPGIGVPQRLDGRYKGQAGLPSRREHVQGEQGHGRWERHDAPPESASNERQESLARNLRNQRTSRSTRAADGSRGPDSARATYAYDERGNRTAATDPIGKTTHSVHDDAGRLARVTDPLGDTAQVVCDAAGLIVEVTDPSGTTTRTERDVLDTDGTHGRRPRSSTRQLAEPAP